MSKEMDDAARSGAKSAEDLGRSSINAARQAAKVPRKIHRSAKAAKRAAEASGVVLSPYIGLIAIGILILILLIVILVSGLSQVQFEKVMRVTPQEKGVPIKSEKEILKEEENGGESIQKALYDQEFAKENTKKLLSVIASEKLKARNEALESAITEARMMFPEYGIDMARSISYARFDRKVASLPLTVNTGSDGKKKDTGRIIQEFDLSWAGPSSLSTITWEPLDRSSNPSSDIKHVNDGSPWDWSTGANQGKFLLENIGRISVGEGGFAMLDNGDGTQDYMIATGPYFGDWGSRYRITFSDGSVITAFKFDGKGHTYDGDSVTPGGAIQDPNKGGSQAKEILEALCYYRFVEGGNVISAIGSPGQKTIEKIELIEGTISSNFQGSVTSTDYQILAAFTVALSNGELYKSGEQIYNAKGISLKKDYSLSAILSHKWGEYSYEKTLRDRLNSVGNGNAFYDVTFEKNTNGSIVFTGTDTHKELRDIDIFTEVTYPGSEEAEIEVADPHNPGKTMKVKILIPVMKTRLEKSTVQKEVEVTVHTNYVKPIIKERPFEETAESLFQIQMDDPYIGSMSDRDHDGIVDDDTATINNREAIIQISHNTLATLGEDSDTKALASGVYGNGILSLPFLPGTYQILHGFGYRGYIGEGASTYHEGIDIENEMYSPILATGDGVVCRIAYNSAAGNYVSIDHGDGLITNYLHLPDGGIHVSMGQKVVRGQEIAVVGMTGVSFSPHLHFEVEYDGRCVDPLPYLGLEPNAKVMVVQ